MFFFFNQLLSFSVEPVCIENVNTIYKASIGESLEITCSVLAHPDNVTFFWNIDDQKKPNFSLFSFTSNKLTSVMRLEITSDQDFQKYTCKAKNKIGLQKDGCTFIIIPKGKCDF